MEPRLLNLFRAGLAILFCAAVVGAQAAASADTIYLKRGGSLNGTVVEGTSTIELNMSDGSATFNKDEIDHIEKNSINEKPAAGAASTASAVSKLKAGASKAVNAVKQKTAGAMKKVKSSTASLTKPIQRSESAKAKEKAVNDSLMEMQRALKKTHERDMAVSKQKRALKKEGFSF